MMNLSNYELGEELFKTTEDTMLLKTERCIVTAFKDTLALPLTINGKIPGFFMHGAGRLIIDAIIETSKGAIGKSIEKTLTKPFIILGDIEKVKDKMTKADMARLGVMGYENLEAFREKAEEVCERILNRRINGIRIDRRLASVFFFVNDENSCDTLISKNTRKLVYVTRGKVYVFSDDKSLITGPEEVFLSKHGKTVIIANGSVLIEK